MPVLYCSVRTGFADPDPDPYNFPDPDPTLMSTTKLTGRGNLIMYACCLAPGEPTDNENQVKNKKYRFGYITSMEQ